MAQINCIVDLEDSPLADESADRGEAFHPTQVADPDAHGCASYCPENLAPGRSSNASLQSRAKNRLSWQSTNAPSRPPHVPTGSSCEKCYLKISGRPSGLFSPIDRGRRRRTRRLGRRHRPLEREGALWSGRRWQGRSRQRLAS